MSKLKDLLVDEYTSPCPATVDKEMGIVEALGMMEADGIRHLPVVDNGKPVGILTQRDLKVVTNLNFAQKLTVADLMVKEPFTVYTKTPLENVAFEMSSKKIGSAIVIDEQGRVDGIFTTTDALNALIEVIREN
jgi:acetoin utilization protein AcuB